MALLPVEAARSKWSQGGSTGVGLSQADSTRFRSIHPRFHLVPWVGGCPLDRGNLRLGRVSSRKHIHISTKSTIPETCSMGGENMGI
ncbi:hypothetical protein Taro_004462 [Colocasia esculenta]|uniref:Uncharacterized protein n=1 Tax=Colocasia esculenta TaxID=4460 RepID=A0A843TRP6_COLES|nr:hypothetical protein [Colocasia esculenta]